MMVRFRTSRRLLTDLMVAQAGDSDPAWDVIAAWSCNIIPGERYSRWTQSKGTAQRLSDWRRRLCLSLTGFSLRLAPVEWGPSTRHGIRAWIAWWRSKS